MNSGSVSPQFPRLQDFRDQGRGECFARQHEDGLHEEHQCAIMMNKNSKPGGPDSEYRIHAESDLAKSPPPGAANPGRYARQVKRKLRLAMAKNCHGTSGCVGVRREAIAPRRFAMDAPAPKAPSPVAKGSLCRRSPTHSLPIFPIPIQMVCSRSLNLTRTPGPVISLTRRPKNTGK